MTWTENFGNVLANESSNVMGINCPASIVLSPAGDSPF